MLRRLVYQFYLGVAIGGVVLHGARPSLVLDESPARPGEWGFHPADGSVLKLTPPSFAWRPQKDAASYTLQCSQDETFNTVEYEAAGLEFNVHCPPKVFAPGRWYWRFAFMDANGNRSPWSRPRSFTILEKAKPFPMPPMEELFKRIPSTHPRLFVRPEQLPELRRLAKTDLKNQYRQLIAECERILKDPPSTAEPPKYPDGIERGSEEWRKIWWGNRVYTIRVLNSAATLGFTYLISGNREYGELARRLLMEAAEWDPRGSTGYRYNDEAGMPYAYYFSRTYTFINDLLTEEEREKCRKIMRIRGNEMYEHLFPRHLWRPYSSHANRAWHFLGEVAIAFFDEIPESRDWLRFVMNVFYNVYPVWCDEDGGWHEGMAYWRSYINRFTWWADVMRTAFGINAYEKPYFSQIGYYPMYLQPPGTKGGGFGDLCAELRSEGNVPLMTIFAAQAQNPYWQWYVEAHGGPQNVGGYIGFIRGILPKVDSKPPTDLPTSRCFHGVGQAVLNTTLLNAKDNVELIFKSSPFGSQSHGYEAQNAFLLYAYGERLLIRTGHRDMYGSDHHRNWMWETKSVNSITVNGRGQLKHSPAARGRITGFYTSRQFDFVEGEAGEAYGRMLRRFTRSILFFKPKLIIIYDRLIAPEPSTFEWWLHAPTKMQIKDQHNIFVRNRTAACHIEFLTPQHLELKQTDRFDPPPRPRIKLVEYHLVASTPSKSKQVEFITLLRPHRVGSALSPRSELRRLANGYLLRVQQEDGDVIVLLRNRDGGELGHGPYRTQKDILAVQLDRSGKQVVLFEK